MKKINAMVLAEFIVAIFICGVLMTLSVHMFRANDMTKVPYIYSFLNQIPEANTYAVKECNFSGGCKDKGALPDNRETYCALLTEALGTSGDVDCKDGIKETHKDLNGENELNLYKNFTLINGVSVYNLSYQGAQWQGNNPKYIDAFIGIKVRKSKPSTSDETARKGNGSIGENIFPVRIFKNGEIIPSYYEDLETFNDDELFAYKVVLNKTKDNGELREDITLSFSPDGSNSTDVKEKVSRTTFKDAVCRAGGINELRHYFPDITDISCDSTVVLNECANNQDKTAYCYVQYIKPQATGIFKFFNI